VSSPFAATKCTEFEVMCQLSCTARQQGSWYFLELSTANELITVCESKVTDFYWWGRWEDRAYIFTLPRGVWCVQEIPHG